jgi:predicted deacylase
MSDRPAALVVDHLRAGPGERVMGQVTVDLGTTSVEVPLVLVNGSRPGPRVGVTGGIHGAEYVSIAALREVALSLDPAAVTGSLVASLISNPAAYAARAIYVDPLDGRNLNRVFPGDPAGGPTERLASWLWRHVIEPSERFLDVHCGDMNEALVSFCGIEETGDPKVDRMSRAMADAYALDYLVYGPTPGSTTSAAAAAGIPAVLGEVGGQGLWPASDVALHAAGLRRALHAAGLIPEPEPGPRRATRVLARDVWLRSEVGGCWHPAVSVGDEVAEGQRLGEVQDAFGATLRTVTAPLSGVVLFRVTSLAMNPGDPLLAIGA